jgi:uncharacterized protein (DUF2236 family)
LYCTVPAFLTPVVRAMMTLPVPLAITKRLGVGFVVFRLATRIFPHAIPKKPWTILKTAIDGIRYSF